MAGACPLPRADAPLVSSLLRSTDCHVQTLARAGYDALLAPSGTFASTLTVLLTIYVALLGYRLMLGGSPLNVSEMTILVVKIGAVVALSTQWATYQTVIYRALFDGPQQIGDAILNGLSASGAAYGGDVFRGLQRAFDHLTAFSPASPPGAATGSAASPDLPAIPPATGGAAQTTERIEVENILTKQGFDSILMQISAVVLLLSTLGLLLVSKIVLALLLSIGPAFLALILFEQTRGLFEGWLRASLAFAFAPLSTTIVLGLGLALLSPWLTEIEVMRDTRTYTPGVAFGVLILVVVLAGVSLGLSAAACVIACGFRLPRVWKDGPSHATRSDQEQVVVHSQPSRAERIAAVVSRDRRDGAVSTSTPAETLSISDARRAAAAPPSEPRRQEEVAIETRLGQAPRRSATPHLGRGVRSEA